MKKLFFSVAIILIALSLPTFGQGKKPTTKSVSKKQVAKKPATKKVAVTKKKKAPKLNVAKILKGSRQSQLDQNRHADKYRLTRIKDDDQLKTFKKAGRLVKLESNNNFKVDRRLKGKFRLVRPWVRDYLNNLGLQFKKKFGHRIQVNSAVRTIERQKELRRTNGNAAAISGPTASSHPTGCTVDVARANLSAKEDQWLGLHLALSEYLRKIEVSKERKQKVYHFMVFVPKTYATQLAEKKKSPTKKKPVGKTAKTKLVQNNGKRTTAKTR